SSPASAGGAFRRSSWPPTPHWKATAPRCTSPACWPRWGFALRVWHAVCLPARCWNSPTVRCWPTPWRAAAVSDTAARRRTRRGYARSQDKQGTGCHSHATRYDLEPADEPDDDSGSAHDPVHGNPAAADHGPAGEDPARTAGEPRPGDQGELRRAARDGG